MDFEKEAIFTPGKKLKDLDLKELHDEFYESDDYLPGGRMWQDSMYD
jgi:hypothetical protein